MAAAPIETLLLRDTRHGGPKRQPQTVATHLATFVGGATATVDIATVDIAIYDFRPSTASLATTVGNASVRAADSGVRVRIAYDAGKPTTPRARTFARMAADPAPPGATGPHDFMHNKILITDDNLVTGWYNFSANAEKNFREPAADQF